MECEEFAVIAFWALHETVDKFKCIRHFYIPNPKKRMVKDVGGTELYEVLYLSNHSSNKNKEIFFFFEGPQIENNNINLIENSESILQCAFLKLDIQDYELKKV